MRRFLCAALFVGLVIAQGNAHAQRSSFRGVAPWPDVPEITDESTEALPNSGAQRGRRLPTPEWPGTEHSRPISPQSAPSPAPATAPGSRSARQDQASRTRQSGDRVEERTRRRPARRSVERYSEPKPVPPVPQRFDQPSKTAGDVDPDQELQPIAAQGDEVDSEQNAEDPPMDDAAVAERPEAIPGAEADAEQDAEHPPMEEAVIAESAEAEPDGKPVSEQNAEDPPMDDAVAAERAEPVPGAEADGEQEAEHPPLEEAVIAETAEAEPDGEPVAEQNAEDPPMDDAVAVERAEAVPGAEADSEQNADPPLEEAVIAERAEAEPDGKPVAEQNAEDPPMDDAVVTERAEAVPGAEADAEQDAERPPIKEAVIAERAEAEPDGEPVSEQNAEDPPMDDAVAAERAEAVPGGEADSEQNTDPPMEEAVIAESAETETDGEPVSEQNAEDPPMDDAVAAERPEAIPGAEADAEQNAEHPPMEEAVIAETAEAEPDGEPVLEQNAEDPPMDDAVAAERAIPGAEADAEQDAEHPPMEEAVTAESAQVEPDGEPVSEQNAEDPPMDGAVAAERAEAVPGAEADGEQEAEHPPMEEAVIAETAEAEPDGEPVSEQNAEDPPMDDAVAAERAEAAPDVEVGPELNGEVVDEAAAVQHSEAGEEGNAATRGDGIVGAPAVETETARDKVAALAAPAPTPPAAPHDVGLGKLIGQMIVTGFDGTTPEDGGVKRLIALLESGKAGGALITPRNVRSPEQLRALIDALKKANAETAPFLMVAHEGGDGQSLSAMHGFSMYPSAVELGRSNDPLNAFSVYFHMAGELASYGFNVNLGPVVDLEPKGGGAGAGEAAARTFGPEPKHVAAFGKAFRLAHRQKGIATVLKYFPRQAGSEDDGSVEASLETYRQLIESDNADMVMTSHLIDPAFSDAAGRPASLSVKAIRKRLREDLGFKGVVMSADIGDPAVAALLPLSQRVAGAIGAGSDILLIGERAPPQDGAVEAIAAIVREAVASGRLSRDQLAASHARIMSMKQSLGASGKAIASAEGKGALEPAAE